jgi:hypothetical protein
LSPDGQLLAVTNLYDGVDFYDMKSRQQVRSFVDRIEKNVAIDITFIQKGAAILLGGSCGRATICDSKTGEEIIVLEHEGKSYTLPLSALIDLLLAHNIVQTVVRSSDLSAPVSLLST